MINRQKWKLCKKQYDIYIACYDQTAHRRLLAWRLTFVPSWLAISSCRLESLHSFSSLRFSSFSLSSSLNTDVRVLHFTASCSCQQHHDYLSLYRIHTLKCMNILVSSLAPLCHEFNFPLKHIERAKRNSIMRTGLCSSGVQGRAPNHRGYAAEPLKLKAFHPQTSKERSRYSVLSILIHHTLLPLNMQHIDV